MGNNILESILIVFIIALFVTVFFRRLRLSVILGYLLVGALVGPHAFGLIPESNNITQLAEFGIVFLMFTVGLEFSLPKLFSLKKSVFLIGGLQVLLSIIFTTLIGLFLKMNLMTSVIIGGIVAMSSTALVIKQLHDQRELHSTHGLNAIGILLFQDLAVIPFIILIASLSQDATHLGLIFLWALLKGIVAIFIITLIGTRLLKPLFRLIANTHASELFTLSVLLVTLAAAWLTHILGLSYALGAFVAGMMLSETEFRHQIEVEIRPFRDILLGLFFISIGMLTNISTWYETWIWIALLVSALVLGKFLLITLICRLSGQTFSVSLRSGLVLAQGGEFGFAMLTLALQHQIIPSDYAQVILASLLISIALSPIFIYFNENIAAFFARKKTPPHSIDVEKELQEKAKHLHDHIILCGYGRVGQHIARLLEQIEFSYIGLDLDASLVERASLAGDNVIYGDASHPQILKAVGIQHAKLLVISINHLQTTINILSTIRNKYPNLPILVRCRDDKELQQLKKFRATRIIAEIFETSLTLSHHLMRLINMPAEKASALLQRVRDKDYDLLHKVFTGKYVEDEKNNELFNKELRPIPLPKGSYSLNHSIEDLHLENYDIEVIAIRRGKLKHVKPKSNLVLRANDILILFGELQNLDLAESFLIDGK